MCPRWIIPLCAVVWILQFLAFSCAYATLFLAGEHVAEAAANSGRAGKSTWSLPADTGDRAISPKPVAQVEDRNKFSSLLLGTMDGKILNLNIFGEIQWFFDSDLGPLVSGSLDQYDFLGNEGKDRYRVIPSLDGQLFMYMQKPDATVLQRMPITADTLLSSSQKLGQDVVAGGKDIRSYGVDLDTGKVFYECGIEGCRYAPAEATDPGERSEEEVARRTIVVYRTTRVIRAVNGLDGSERWNISMSNMEVKLPQGTHSCRAPLPSDPLIDLVYKVIPPEGRVVAHERLRPDRILWERRLDSPIAKLWEISTEGVIEEVSILDPTVLLNVPGLAGGAAGDYHALQYQQQTALAGHFDTMSYLGMYSGARYMIHGERKNEFLPPSTALSVGPSKIFTVAPDIADSRGGCSADEVNAVMQLGSDHPNSEGVYFTTAPADRRDVQPHTGGLASRLKDFLGSRPQSNQLGHNHQLSPEPDLWGFALLGVYWMEVLMTFGLCMLPTMLYQLYKLTVAEELAFSMEDSSTGTTAPRRSDSATTTVMVSVKSQASLADPSEDLLVDGEYKSRYLEDFEPVRCLGKGGFGIVFEARKIMEDCNYAVKRISVPNTLSAKERVRREVKALAKLDHPGIVRYYQSWFESPPPGWQESMDKEILEKLKELGVPQNDSYIPTATSTTTDASISSIPGRNVDPDLLSGSGGNASTRSQTDDGSTPKAEDLARDPFLAKRCAPEDSENFVVFKADSNSTSNPAHLPDWSCSNGGVVFRDDDAVSDGAGDISLSVDSGLTSGSGGNGALPRAAAGADKMGRSKFWLNSATDSSASASSSPPEVVFRRRRRPTEKERVTSHDKVLQTTPNRTEPNRTYLYIQMQLCADHTLRHWLRRTPETERKRPQLLLWFRQILDAVDYVHGCNMIHRDLKPSNIFFTHTGSVKVGDFGLVAEVAAQCVTPEGADLDNISRGGSPVSPNCHTNDVGTQLYMSPEQVAGRCYTHKVDVFSVGLVYFELLVAFTTEMERVQAICDAKRGRLPEGFERENPADAQVVRWMVQRSPERRPECSEILSSDIFKET